MVVEVVVVGGAASAVNALDETSGEDGSKRKSHLVRHGWTPE